MDLGDVDTLYWIAIFLFITHFIGDFVFQSHRVASNKSKDFGILALHVGIYSAVIAVLPAIMWIIGLVTIINALIFVGANFVIHFITDAITSRMSSKLWMKQDWHNFFVVIGLDQLIHAVTLLLTMAWLINTITQVPSNIFNLQ